MANYYLRTLAYYELDGENQYELWNQNKLILVNLLIHFLVKGE